MKTITSRDDFSKLDIKVEKDIEKYLAGTDLSCPIVKSVEQDDDLSCEMAVSYRFTFIYKDNEGGQTKEGYATYFANGTHMIQIEPNAEEIASKEQDWNVIYDDYGGALIYTLRHDGYRKGQPVMINDVTIRVEPANKSKTAIVPIVDKVVAALSS
jgi:hypothetical protein